MDTAFVNRVGVTRGWQYQALKFYPSQPRLPLDQENQPVLLDDGCRRPYAGGKRSVLSARRPIQLHARRFSAGGLRNWPRDIRRAAVRGRQDGSRRQRPAHALAEHRRQRAAGPGNLLRSRGPLSRAIVESRACASACSPARASTATRRTATSRSTIARTGENVYRVHIMNTRNTYQFTPRFFVRGGRAVRFVARTCAHRFSGVVRVVARHRRARGVRVAVRNSSRRAGPRSLHGYSARVFLQSVLSRALLIAATSRPALTPSRL